jgi:hypothetical protein
VKFTDVVVTFVCGLGGNFGAETMLMTLSICLWIAGGVCFSSKYVGGKFLR